VRRESVLVVQPTLIVLVMGSALFLATAIAMKDGWVRTVQHPCVKITALVMAIARHQALVNVISPMRVLIAPRCLMMERKCLLLALVKDT
jgi:hypothetical protein